LWRFTRDGLELDLDGLRAEVVVPGALIEDDGVQSDAVVQRIGPIRGVLLTLLS
jgi:hypothetical protein